MFRFLLVALACVCIPVSLISPVAAQGMGGFGGMGSSPNSSDSRSEAASWITDPPPGMGQQNTVLDYIAVNGTAKIRVKPEEVRVVMAVFTEGESAAETQSANEKQILAVRKQWRKLGIPEDKIVEDFISVLPWYEWEREDHEGSNDVYRQRRAGYRMQTNLHVAVPTEAKAMEAIHQAFEHGVQDIITFDYWSPELDAKKREARKAALEAAQEKAEVLLAVFDERPPVINIDERSKVFFPKSLYQTFENVLEEAVQWSGGDDEWIKAYRPKMTFYDGLKGDADVRSSEIVMRPEINVVSTVTIYYQSPATKDSKSTKSKP